MAQSTAFSVWLFRTQETSWYRYEDVWVTRVGEGEPINRTGDHMDPVAWMQVVAAAQMRPGATPFEASGHPSWSPDGDQIAFVSNRAGARHIFVMPVLAGAARQVSPLQTAGTGPAWSADGTALAFPTRSDDGTRRITMTSLETGDARHVPVVSTMSGISNLSWSPDDRFFAYSEGGETNQASALGVTRISDGFGLPPDGRSLWGNEPQLVTRQPDPLLRVQSRW